MSNAITLNSAPVGSILTELRGQLNDLSPVLRAIGDDMTERVKLRFSTSTGPNGAPWQPNSQATLIRYLEAREGFSRKTGKIVAKGRQMAIAKKPLIGQGGALSGQIFPMYESEAVTVGSSQIYAAMQHYGGSKSEFPHLWGDIPARPFFPITPAGALDPDEEGSIIETLRLYLSG